MSVVTKKKTSNLWLNIVEVVMVISLSSVFVAGFILNSPTAIITASVITALLIIQSIAEHFHAKAMRKLYGWV